MSGAECRRAARLVRKPIEIIVWLALGAAARVDR